jgi:hypothetical protein
VGTCGECVGVERSRQVIHEPLVLRDGLWVSACTFPYLVNKNRTYWLWLAIEPFHSQAPVEDRKHTTFSGDDLDDDFTDHLSDHASDGGGAGASDDEQPAVSAAKQHKPRDGKGKGTKAAQPRDGKGKGTKAAKAKVVTF